MEEHEDPTSLPAQRIAEPQPPAKSGPKRRNRTAKPRSATDKATDPPKPPDQPQGQRHSTGAGWPGAVPAVGPELGAKPKHAGGRPRKIADPEEMNRLVDAYIEDRKTAGQPITRTGLILAVGLASDEGWDGYCKRPEFDEAIKRARRLIEEVYEARLHGKDCVGAIFALKNMGWSDRLDIESRGWLASIDVTRLSDEQLTRLRAGESALSVLGTPAQVVKALPAGSAVPDK